MLTYGKKTLLTYDKYNIDKSIYIQISCYFKKIQLRDLDLEDVM